MKITSLILASLAFAPIIGVAVDWPQWGGKQERNMYSPAKGLPSQFDPGKPKSGTEEIDLATTKNVRWAVKVGSQRDRKSVV